MTASITAHDLAKLTSSGANIELLDVRMPAEYQEMHVGCARNLPLDRLNPETLKASQDGSSSGPIYVICRSGSRGRQACERLAAAGLQAVNVEGGTLAWEAAGLPLVRGKKAISLERQVRIAAGFLALLGAALALTVHPYFAGLSAFIGAGLMFSGITDTCGMAMILARMPWNQASGSTPEPVCRV